MAEEQKRPKPADYFSDWKQREALAEKMIPLIGKLYREHNVNTYIYGQQLYSRSVIDIMKAHRFVRQVEQNELSEFETYPVVQALADLNLGRAHIDVGRIAVGFMKDNGGLSIDDYVKREVAEAIDTDSKPIPESRDVVLYGFGRIGRLMARLLIEKTGGGDVLRLRAIVVRKSKSSDDLEKRASLLRRDSVHGPFRGTIRVDEEAQAFVANGNLIKIIYADQPEDIDYTAYGINNAIIVENTGKLTDEAGLSRHLKCKGVSQVLLTAPAKGDIKNIVFGVNHETILPGEQILSAASCTTNAVVPALKAVNDKYGVKSGHIETVHSYTNDQNLIDNYHKAERRGRSAPLNMVITSTGAAKAVAKALPELAGKLTGNAIRVPTPNVSMAILNLELNQDVSVDELNEYMRHMALHSPLRKQIDYTNSTEVVSTDIVGSRHACVFDAQATITQGNRVVMYLWYDNEFGYSCQVHRVLEKMAGVNFRTYPKN